MYLGVAGPTQKHAAGESSLHRSKTGEAGDSGGKRPSAKPPHHRKNGRNQPVDRSFDKLKGAFGTPSSPELLKKQNKLVRLKIAQDRQSPPSWNDRILLGEEEESKMDEGQDEHPFWRHEEPTQNLEAAQLQLQQLRDALGFMVRFSKEDKRKTAELERKIRKLQHENSCLREENQFRDDFVGTLQHSHKTQTEEKRQVGEIAHELVFSVSTHLWDVLQILQARDQGEMDAVVLAATTAVRTAMNDLEMQNHKLHELGFGMTERESETLSTLFTKPPTGAGVSASSDCCDATEDTGYYYGLQTRSQAERAPALSHSTVVKIQALARGFVAFRKYRKQANRVLALQAHIRGHLARNSVSRLREQQEEERQARRLEASKQIQAIVRGFVAVRQYAKFLKRAVVVQNFVRGNLARRALANAYLSQERKRDCAAVKLQAVARGFVELRRFIKTVRCIVVVQAHVRGFLARNHAKALSLQKANRFWWNRSKAAKRQRNRIGRIFRPVYRSMSREKPVVAMSDQVASKPDQHKEDDCSAAGNLFNQEVTHLIREEATQERRPYRRSCAASSRKKLPRTKVLTRTCSSSSPGSITTETEDHHSATVCSRTNREGAAADELSSVHSG